MSKRARFGIRHCQSSNFLGNINLADPMLSDTLASRGDILSGGSRFFDYAETSPMYIYGSNRLLKWPISGPELSGGRHFAAAIESMSQRVRFGARNSQISNFLRHIPSAGPHVFRNVGAHETRYCLGGTSPRCPIRNFHNVQIRLKSVNELVELGARTFWRPPMYHPP